MQVAWTASLLSNASDRSVSAFGVRGRSVQLSMLLMLSLAQMHVFAQESQPDGSSPSAAERDYSPLPTEQQLPRAMHSAKEILPEITVGVDSGALRGEDHRVLQAAVDYIAGLGGGTVHIGPGKYLMGDSLHLRSGVRIVGSGKETVLKKVAAVVVPLGLDGDFGEQQVTTQDGGQFEVGQSIAVWDNAAGGFHTTVARITGRTDTTYSIDRPLMADCLLTRNAKAASVYPVISGYDVVDAAVSELTIDGNKEQNPHLNGCRGGGIFLYRGFGTKISNCVVSNYNGDGISFQQSNDVVVSSCTVEGNTQLGIHPGSGSQRPVIRDCVARNNGTDGLFLCWRVRHGTFEGNILENNGRFGISIGHKDTDNLLRSNQIRGNDSHGVYFRDESLGMAGHRNRLVDNVIENNGSEPGTAAIRVRGVTNSLTFEGNTIRDTRPAEARTQTVGVMLEENVGDVTLSGNSIKAAKEIEDQRSQRK
jgi:parallel beta-helix repeat protein